MEQRKATQTPLELEDSSLTSPLTGASFVDKSEALKAIDSVVALGIAKDKVSILLAPQSGERQLDFERQPHMLEAVGGGAIVGGSVGALMASLTAVGTLAAGESLLVAGPLVAAFVGAGAGGTLGSLLGALVGWGLPEHLAKIVENEVLQGRIVVKVSASPEQTAAVEEVLREFGGKVLVGG